jgi:hypothetical protein
MTQYKGIVVKQTYGELLQELSNLAIKAAEVEGADTVGAFLPIGQFGVSRQYGEFSSLQEWLGDFGAVLEGFLCSHEGEEIEDWHV